MDENIVSVEGLSVKIGHRYILKNINWRVEQGENWIVFGMNGSGKTTLLSIVSGYAFPTEGTVSVFGESYSNENILAARKRIGWVSASFFDSRYSQESVLDIVLSGASGALGLRHYPTDKEIVRAKEILAFFGLSDKIGRSFSTLSKGERQSVLLARSLMCKPELLILDEPCTGLDMYSRARLFSMLRSLAASGVTMVYVTHYVEEALDIFDRALFLRGGMAMAQGRTDDLFTTQMMTRLIDYPVQITQGDNGEIRSSITVERPLGTLLDWGER